MPKWLKWLLQVSAIALTSVVPIGYILIKYGASDTEIREIKYGGINMFWGTIIFIIVVLLTLWILNGLLMKWKEDIKKKPFGSKSRLLQQVLLISIFVGGIFFLNYVANFIESNTDGFLTILRTYRDDFSYLVSFVVVGFLIDRTIDIWG